MVNGNVNARFLLDLLPKQYNYYMKYLVALLILFFCTLQTFGQQEYFIYLQTENSQPFYTRISNKVFSSTGSGYLILSKLPDSVTSITVGFPKNVFPEQQFNIPVNHKDGGYLIKNFGDKGWGLFNLQTASIIMTLTAPEEKKKPEISGVRKTDAFSLLLANAVNDTAVLYAAVRAPKPAPPVVVVEKKKDTLTGVNIEPAQKDSIAVAKKASDKKDSSQVAKSPAHPNTDTINTANAALTQNKQSTIVKNKTTGKDTIGIAKNAQVATAHPPAKTAPKKDSSLLARNTAAHKKDSVAVARKFSLFRGKDRAAKNDSERKDTIILMGSGKPAAGKPIAKNITAKTDSSVVIKKKILQAPEEKRDALMNNKDAVVIEKIPVKKDSVANNAGKKDTLEAVVKTETIQPITEKKDSTFNAPAKRLRPLVNKVAELLTDTSYIAVFVDESKDKFDTVRISIPFNELAAFSGLNKPLTRLTDTVIDQKIKDSVANNAADLTRPMNKRPDSVTARKPAKDSNISSSDTVVPSLIKDSAVVTKKKTDSVSATTEPPVIKKEAPEKRTDSASMLPTQTTAGKLRKDSLVAIPINDSNVHAAKPPLVNKKDSLIITKDTASAKAPGQPLFSNSDCKEIAADADIDKLRIKMLVVGTDEDRISLAKRLFKQKCLLSKQVRALSELFKTDEGKYKWLDATYPFVSDTGNFGALGELIKDEYYLNRFKAMLRH